MQRGGRGHKLIYFNLTWQYELTDKQMDKQTDRWTNGRTDEQTEERRGGWTDGQIDR